MTSDIIILFLNYLLAAGVCNFIVVFSQEDGFACPKSDVFKRYLISDPDFIFILIKKSWIDKTWTGLLAVNLTLYGRDVLQLDVVSNGVLSCIPYVGMFAMASTAKVFDHCRQNDYLPLSILRKIFTGLGMIIPAVCMASLRFVSEKDTIGNVVLLTLGMSGHQLGEAISFCYRNS